MFDTVRPTAVADRLRRVLAGGCAMLVLALTIFAASPGAHRLLHDEDHGHAHAVAEDACAVVLFASGVSLPYACVTVAPPITALHGVSPVAAADVFLVSPRYLRHPERGPPASSVS
jgi:hypothetical protein